jgi:hypothetical protein
MMWKNKTNSYKFLRSLSRWPKYFMVNACHKQLSAIAKGGIQCDLIAVMVITSTWVIKWFQWLTLTMFKASSRTIRSSWRKLNLIFSQTRIQVWKLINHLIKTDINGALNVQNTITNARKLQIKVVWNWLEDYTVKA